MDINTLFAHPETFTFANLEKVTGTLTKTEMQEYRYRDKWEVLVYSYFNRYPTHPKVPLMLGGEVTLDEWDDTHKRRKIVRHVRINVDLPTWLKKTVGLKEIVFVQTSVIDAINKTMVIHNVNQTWSDKLCIGDDCEYVATGSDETIFHQKAFFKLPSIPMVKKIEGLLSKSYEKNTGEGRLMDHAFVKDAMDAGFVNQVLHNPATGQPNETWSVIKDINAQGKKVSKNGKPRKSGKTSKRSKDPSKITGNESSCEHSDDEEGTETAEDPFELTIENRPLFHGGLLCIACALWPLLFFGSLKLSATVISLYTVIITVAAGYLHMKSHINWWVTILQPNPVEPAQLKGSPVSRAQSGPIVNDATTASEEILSNAKPPTRAQSPHPKTIVSQLQQQSVPSRKTSSLAEYSPEVDEELPVEEDDEDSIALSEDESPAESASDSSEEEEESDENDIEDSYREAHTDDPDLEPYLKAPLRDLQVSVPCWIDRTLTNAGIMFVIVVKVAGNKRTVERSYGDFVKFKKSLARKIPNCKAHQEYTSLPKRKRGNDFSLSLALESRRVALENWLRILVQDEAVSKLGPKFLTSFLTYRWDNPPTIRKVTGAKKFFGSNPSPVLDLGSASDLKQAIFAKARWGCCWKEVYVTLDRSKGLINCFCRFPANKSPHCVISIYDIDSIQRQANLEDRNETTDASHAATPLFSFFEIITTSQDHFYFCCKSREQAEDWVQEINASRTKSMNSPALKSTDMPEVAKKKSISSIRAVLRPETPTGIKSSSPLPSSASAQQRIILNKKQIIFKTSHDELPTDLAIRLLTEILNISRDFVSAKNTISDEITDQLQKFSEHASVLQVISLEHLNTHAMKLSFFLNVYHLLLIHGTLELRITPQDSSRRRRMLFSSVSYEIGGALFSLQELDLCILRSSMARPTAFRTAIGYSRCHFAKRDPRRNLAIAKPDPRIIFVLNTGSKSSIYNTWIFSADPVALSCELDHAAIHFLNEQLQVDCDKAIIHLPKVCRWLSADLGGTKTRMLKSLMPYMPAAMESDIRKLSKPKVGSKSGEKPAKIKIRYASYDSTPRGFFLMGHDTATNPASEVICSLRKSKKGDHHVQTDIPRSVGPSVSNSPVIRHLEEFSMNKEVPAQIG